MILNIEGNIGEENIYQIFLLTIIVLYVTICDITGDGISPKRSTDHLSKRS